MKIAERPERRQRADQLEICRQRKGDMDETAQAGDAVDRRGAVDVARDRPAMTITVPRLPFPDKGDDVRPIASQRSLNQSGPSMPTSADRSPSGELCRSRIW